MFRYYAIVVLLRALEEPQKCITTPAHAWFGYAVLAVSDAGDERVDSSWILTAIWDTIVLHVSNLLATET